VGEDYGSIFVQNMLIIFCVKSVTCSVLPDKTAVDFDASLWDRLEPNNANHTWKKLCRQE